MLVFDLSEVSLGDLRRRGKLANKKPAQMAGSFVLKPILFKRRLFAAEAPLVSCG
jgi:hypothetical protein